MTTDMQTIHENAGKAYDAFTTIQRGEDTITVQRDDAPAWVGELVRDAHDDMLPDDWRYESIRSALGAIHDYAAVDLDGLAHEYADGNVDVYTGARLAWLSSNLNRMSYCDEAADEFGSESRGSIAEQIGLGQYMESREIFASVARSLETRADEIADTDNDNGEGN